VESETKVSVVRIDVFIVLGQNPQSFWVFLHS